MPKILRRPMFRGGPINSEGTGITSGLDNRIGLKDSFSLEDISKYFSPEVMSEEEAKTKSDIYPFVKRNPSELLYTLPLARSGGIGSGFLKTFGKEGSRYYLDKYGRYIKEEPNFIAGKEGVSIYEPPAFGTNQAYKEVVGPYLSGAKELTFTGLKKLKDYALSIGLGGAAAGVGYDIYKKSKKEEPKNTLPITPKEGPEPEETTQKAELPTLEQDIDSYNKLLLDRAGSDKDEYTRQKYLELAKFGLNLLKPNAPGTNPSLLSNIARAAEKPLEEYGNLSMQQSKEDRALKQLATQLAFQKHMPGNIAKGIQDLMASDKNMTVEEARSIVTTGKNQHNINKEKMAEVEVKKKELEELVSKDPILKKLSKIDPSFINSYSKIAVEQNLYNHELKGLASDYSVYQPGSIYYYPDKQTGQLLPHKFIKGKLYSIREPEFKLKGI